MSGEDLSRPHRLQIDPNTHVMRGTMLHVIPSERRELEELGTQMTRAAFYSRPGWVAEFVKAHNRASQILSGAISRSHLGS